MAGLQYPEHSRKRDKEPKLPNPVVYKYVIQVPTFNFDYIYNTIFVKNKSTPHILLRDYARGIIEICIIQFKNSEFDPKHFRPPYKSKWPSRVSSIQVLEKKYLKNNDDQYSTIWSSVVSGKGATGIADFGNYVVSPNIGYFSGISLLSSELTDNMLLKEFRSMLTPNDHKNFNKINSHLSFKRLKLITNNSNQEEKQIESIINKFKILLRQPHLKKYQNTVRRNLMGKSIDNKLDVNRCQRWIFQRTLQLGWNPKIHKHYDDSISRDRHMPSASRERIGKKYQWIALYELLALTLDNFKISPEFNNDFPVYNGPWQLSIRDIDPSHTLHSIETNDKIIKKPHWALPLTYNNWFLECNENEWKKKTDDLPDFQKLFSVQDLNKEEWISLSGTYERKQFENKNYFQIVDVQKRDIWFHIQSFFVKKEDLDVFYKWALTQNFWTLSLPSSNKLYSEFAKEFPRYLSCSSFCIEQDWIKPEGENSNSAPFEILIPNVEYIHESDKDASCKKYFSMHFPCKYIYHKLNLNSNISDGTYQLPEGDVGLLDPSVSQGGPSALLIKKSLLQDLLKNDNLALVWIAQGEKLVTGGSKQIYDQLRLNGAFKLDEDKIIGNVTPSYEIFAT